jgi:hypothetical protein
MKVATLLMFSIMVCEAAPLTWGLDRTNSTFYEQDVSATVKVVVVCMKLPYVPLTAAERARWLKRNPGPDHPPLAPERYQYSFVLRDRSGGEPERTLGAHIVEDKTAILGFGPEFSILLISVKPDALIAVYHEYGGVDANVIPLKGPRSGTEMPEIATRLLRERGSDDPLIDSATILGSYDTGDLTIVLHNCRTDVHPEYFRFSLQPHWVPVRDAPAATTQPATSRP